MAILHFPPYMIFDAGCRKGWSLFIGMSEHHSISHIKANNRHGTAGNLLFIKNKYFIAERLKNGALAGDILVNANPITKDPLAIKAHKACPTSATTAQLASSPHEPTTHGPPTTLLDLASYTSGCVLGLFP